MSSMHDRTEELLGLATLVPDDTREQVVREAAGGDEERTQDVLRRLPSRVVGWLEESARDRAASIPRIAGFEVGRVLGEGGFGVVHEAEQLVPVRRRVAVKVIKPGMDSRAVVSRFEAERQALALMDHPGVATIFGGGTTDEGRPYFAMEFVDGRPITRWCDERRMDVRGRVQLMIRVCDAVQHAHGKGIIHRDLKPSNVLVAEEDGRAVPRIIDFGIAKALVPAAGEAAGFTAEGHVVGTPEYMSPEQATGRGDRVDTRSDIYALGVLLYELLGGLRPFESAAFAADGPAAMQRAILERVPPRPSTRLETLASRAGGAVAASRIAEARRADRRSLGRLLRRDLDWLVMKCLEKEPERRYVTASALADDLRRFLADEPLLAGPPAASYRARAFVRRNRAGVVAASAIGVTFLAGFGGTVFGLVEARRQESVADRAARDEAEQRRVATLRADEAEAERRRAEEAEAAAERRAADLEVVAAFQAGQLGGIDLVRMGEMIREGLVERFEVAARREEGAEVDEAEAANRAAALDGQLDGVDFTGLASHLMASNVHEPSFDAIERDFEEQALVQARLFIALARASGGAGLLDICDRAMVRAVELRRERLGGGAPLTIDAVLMLADLRWGQGRRDEAEAMLRGVLETGRAALGVRDPKVLQATNDLGRVLYDKGRTSEGLALFSAALDGYRDVLGPDARRTIVAAMNVGSALQRMGRYDDAEARYGEALEAAVRSLGEADQTTLNLFNLLGGLHRDRRRPEAAEQFARRAYEGTRRLRGDEHPDTITYLGRLARAIEMTGRVDEAERTYRAAIDAFGIVLGDEHPELPGLISNLGALLRRQGRLDEAEPLHLEAIAAGRRIFGDANHRTASYLAHLGTLRRDQGRLDEAEAQWAAALPGYLEHWGIDHAATRSLRRILAGMQEQDERHAEAEPLRRDAVASARRVDAEGGGWLDDDLLALGCNLAAQGRYSQAEPVLRECVAIQGKVLPEDDDRRWITQSWLGHVVAGQGRYAEAEPLLLDAAARLVPEDAGDDDADRPGDEDAVASVRRLVDLYAAWHAVQPEAGHDLRREAWERRLPSPPMPDAG